VPEGDAIHRTAERLRVLEGDVVRADSPHPRAALLGIAERIDGHRLERVEAVGKNLLLTFEDGTVVRSHLRMHGRWRVEPAGRPILGKPWLVLRGAEWQAVQRRGPVLELGRGRTDRLGPDIMAAPPDLDAMLVRFRAAGQSRALGEALLDQTLVAGIGNMWKAEALFVAGVKGVKCQTIAGSRSCHTGSFKPGRRVTDFVISGGKVVSVNLGFVLD